MSVRARLARLDPPPRLVAPGVHESKALASTPEPAGFWGRRGFQWVEWVEVGRRPDPYRWVAIFLSGL